MNGKRVETVLMWTLAIVVPGGLALLALWMGVRAAQQRNAAMARNQTPGAVDTLRDATPTRAFSWTELARRVGAR